MLNAFFLKTKTLFKTKKKNYVIMGVSSLRPIGLGDCITGQWWLKY